ncbi:MAG: AIM24 family protein, partial [Firmicutes bacterium]|nr:AIM24 family protein [Bacillota bacterium]
AFNSTVPGSVIAIDCSKCSYIAQKRAFLAAEKAVEVKIAFTKKAGEGLFGGEGIILQEIKGSGTAFLEIDGDAILCQKVHPN